MLIHRRVEFRRYAFVHLGEERHFESKVSCPRTQHYVPAMKVASDISNKRIGHRVVQKMKEIFNKNGWIPKEVTFDHLMGPTTYSG